MNNLLSEITNIIYPLGMAIIHSLWQGLLIYIILKALLYTIPTRYANTRYYISTGALSIIAGLFIATLLYYIPKGVSTSFTTLLPGSTDRVVIQDSNTIPLPWWDKVKDWYVGHAAQVAFLYITGVLLLTLRMSFQIVSVLKLRSNDLSVAGDFWPDVLEACKERLNLERNIKLYFSPNVTVPMMMGVLKPVVLIPLSLSTQLSMHQAEAILLHELAHIKRHDFLVNIIQMCVETFLFFNPFSWLVSAQVRKEREHCCDDMVVRSTDKLSYAKTLATLETFRQMPQPAIAAKSTKQHLLTRIKRIMDKNNSNINIGQLAGVIIIFALSVAVITFITPDVQAQPKKDKKAKNEYVMPDNNDTDTTLTTSPKVIIRTDRDGDTSKKRKVVDREQIEEVEDVMEALEDIDIERVVSDALAEVDWEEIREEIHEAIEESKEAMAEAMEALDDMPQVDDSVFAEARKQIAKAKKEIALAKEEMAKAREEQQMAIADAREEIAKAKREQSIAMEEARRVAAEARHKASIAREDAHNERIRVTSSYDNILIKMEKDGLINRHKRYKVVKDGNDIYIDGIKQSKEVVKKYGKMFKSDNVTIKGSANSINIKSGN